MKHCDCDGTRHVNSDWTHCCRSRCYIDDRGATLASESSTSRTRACEGRAIAASRDENQDPRRRRRAIEGAVDAPRRALAHERNRRLHFTGPGPNDADASAARAGRRRGESPVHLCQIVGPDPTFVTPTARQTSASFFSAGSGRSAGNATPVRDRMRGTVNH
jgi:hypothetical protein